MSDIKLPVSLLEMLSQPVVIVRSGQIVYMDPAAAALAGNDITGKPASVLLPSHIMNTQADSFVTNAFIGKRSCVVSAKTSEGYRVFALDISEKKLSENERVLRSMRDKLTAVRFSMERLLSCAEDIGSELLISDTSRLNRQCSILQRDLDNIGLLTGLMNNSLPFSPSPLDVTELCRRIISNARFLIRDKALKLSLNAEEHMRINADSELICQLMFNLLANSIAHCGEGGNISVSLLRGDKHIIIGVGDDGDGIPSDELSAVFGKYRSELLLTDGGAGAGLGLAIVRGIAERHGGTVIVESRGKGMGTSVRVMLAYSTPVRRAVKSPAECSDDELMRRMLTQLSCCLSDDCFSGALSD